MCRSVEMASPRTAGKMSDLSPETDLLVAALQQLPIAVVITDTRGSIRSINAALTSVAGYTPEDAVGQPITLLSVGTAERDFPNILQEAIRSCEPWQGEWVCRRRTGDLFSAELTVTSIASPNG